MKTTPERIAKNSAYLLVANIISLGLRFIYGALIFRYLIQDIEGQYIIASNWGSILAINLHSGMIYILIREISLNKEKTRELLGDGLIISAFLFVAVMILSIIAALLVVYVKGDLPIIGYGIVAITLALSMTYLQGVFGAGFKAHEKLIYDACLMLVHAVISLGVLWYVCREPNGLKEIFIAIAAVSLITNLVSFLLGWKVFGFPSLKFRKESLRHLIRESTPLGVAEAVRINYMRAGNLALWIFHQFRNVSSFGVPYNITEQLKFIPGSIRPAVFPAMCQLALSNRKGFEWTYNFLMRLLVILAIPVGMMMMAAAGLILKFYMKDPTNEAILALRILSLIIIISFPSLVIRNIFVALGKQKLDTVISFAALGMLLVLLLLLVPNFDVFGAVAGILISELFLFVIGIVYVYRLGFHLDFIGTFLKPILCSIPLAIAMLLTPREGEILLRLPIYLACIALYVVLIFLLGTLSKLDIENLRRVIAGDDPVDLNGGDWNGNG